MVTQASSDGQRHSLLTAEIGQERLYSQGADSGRSAALSDPELRFDLSESDPSTSTPTKQELRLGPMVGRACHSDVASAPCSDNCAPNHLCIAVSK